MPRYVIDVDYTIEHCNQCPCQYSSDDWPLCIHPEVVKQHRHGKELSFDDTDKRLPKWCPLKTIERVFANDGLRAERDGA